MRRSSATEVYARSSVQLASHAQSIRQQRRSVDLMTQEARPTQRSSIMIARPHFSRDLRTCAPPWSVGYSRSATTPTRDRILLPGPTEPIGSDRPTPNCTTTRTTSNSVTDIALPHLMTLVGVMHRFAGVVASVELSTPRRVLKCSVNSALDRSALSAGYL